MTEAYEIQEEETMCYCCMRRPLNGELKQRASSLAPMLLPYCDECLNANADPEWMISAVLSDHDGAFQDAGDRFGSKVVYWDGHYITVGEFCTQGGYRASPDAYRDRA